jgi:exopolysaccharide biosynthesis polyprenyl glycosylphosphotransferase
VKRYQSAPWVLLLLVGDLVALTVAVFLAYVLRFQSPFFTYEEFHPLDAYIGLFALHLLAVPVSLATAGLYHPKRAVPWLDHLSAIVAGVSIGTILVIVASALLWREFGPSRLLIALVWGLSLVGVVTSRLTLYGVRRFLRARGYERDRLLVVGTGEPARLVIQRARLHPGLGYLPIGVVAEQPGLAEFAGLPVLGTIAEVGDLVRRHNVTELIIAMPTLSHQQLVDIVAQCYGERVNIRVFPDLFQFMTSGVHIGDLNGLPLISVKDVALKGWNAALKRAMDLVGSAVGLVLLSPLMLLIALLIKITSPDGPVFYCQERVGLDGKPFLMIKFRSMRPDAEAETGPVWATPNDPRRTRLGAFLRRYSLDELPQLINVLIGEMSLVGPRAERPHFVEQFRRTIPRYWERHREKAGMTGWAQVNGLRGNTSIEERTAYDLWYVENWTIWLDIKILLKTLIVIFTDRNAY